MYKKNIIWVVLLNLLLINIILAQNTNSHAQQWLSFRDRINIQLKSIENAIKFENIDVLCMIYHDYFLADSLPIKKIKDDLIIDLIHPLYFKTKNNNIKKLNRNLKLKLLSLDQNRIEVQANLVGYKERTYVIYIDLILNKRGYYILNYSQLSLLIAKLGGKIK